MQRPLLQRDRRLGPGRPERRALDVEGVQEVAHRGRRRQRVAEQRRQGVIRAERGEVLAKADASSVTRLGRGPERDPIGDSSS